MAEQKNPVIPQKSDPEKQKKQQRILIVLLILIAAAAVMILYNNGVIGGSASKKPVEQYLAAIASGDFESYVSSMPERIARGYKDDLEASGLDGRAYMRKLYSDYVSEFGDDMTVSLEFTDRSRVDAIYLNDYKISYSQLYGEEIDISSAFELDVTATFSGSVSSDEIELECFVVKTGGKWYIVGCDYKSDNAEE